MFRIAGGGVTLHFFKCTNWGITKGALLLPPPPDNPKLCQFFSSRLEWNTYHPCSHSHLSDFPLKHVPDSWGRGNTPLFLTGGITKGALLLPPPPDNPKLYQFFSSRLEWNTYHPCSHSHLSACPLLSGCMCVSTPVLPCFTHMQRQYQQR